MRAVSRFVKALAAGALALAPAAALAQQAQPASNTTASDTIGPRDLQNFSLSGTVTRRADQPVPVASTPKPRRQTAETRAAAPAEVASDHPAVREPAAPPRRTETASAPAPSPAPRVRTGQAAAPSSSGTTLADAIPSLGAPTASAPAPTPAAAPSFAPEPSPVGPLAPEHKFPILPWLLAALVLGAAGALLFFRNRGREAFAGGPQVDAFVAPPPAAAPRPAPSAGPAPKPPTPASLGIVSTRLRPWVEIGFHPLRCVVDEEKVTVDFELELFNSGSAPARAVLAEASLFTAGPAQDQQIGSFFANPVGEGERIVAIAPLQRVTVRTQVFARREQVQLYEVAGRQVFVPVVAFNALYKWAGGDGQTSVSYLLGRDTKGEKMSPFRVDLGPRIFRGVAARILPTGIRQ
jgi:hypothetical protein